MKKTIFIVLSRIPFPLEKGDKLRAFHQIRELSKHHHLIVCALSDTGIHPDAYQAMKPYVGALYFFPLSKAGIYSRLVKAAFSSTPFQVAWFFSPRIRKKIHALIDHHRPDHLFCQLIRTAPYIQDRKEDKTIDYQDVFSAGLQRRRKVAPWYMRPLLQKEFKRVSNYENLVFSRFDKKTIISYPDREKIPHMRREEITVVPNGVDTGFFKPAGREKGYDVVFTGNMAYPPNVRGAEYLVRQIMPLVWKSLPNTRVVIAGASPAKQVRALASTKVEVTGWVDDIRDIYATSRVFVAPMQIGTGLQNKVLEAMAMELPCVTSPLANQALKATEGEEVLIGRDAAEYAKHVLSLLKNKDLSVRLSKNGHDFVVQHFNWERTTKILQTVITGQQYLITA